MLSDNFKAKVMAGEEAYRFEERNTLITLAPSGTTDYGEIVYYKNSINVPVEIRNFDIDKRKRTYVWNSDEEYYEAQKIVNIHNVEQNLWKSGKRAVSRIVQLAMANRWEMFITLTFSPKMLNRYDEIECKEKWREFQKWAVRRYPKCKLLAVWEYHKKTDVYGGRALHFHVLASNLPLQTFAYLDDKTLKQKTSKSGAPLFMISPKEWPFGLSTVAYLPKDGSDNVRVANYLTKYVSKTRSKKGDKIHMAEAVGNYGAKRYYYTRSLRSCDRVVVTKVLTQKQVEELAGRSGYSLHKDNNDMLVFRKYWEEDENLQDNLDNLNVMEIAPKNQKTKLQLLTGAELEEYNKIF